MTLCHLFLWHRYIRSVSLNLENVINTTFQLSWRLFIQIVYYTLLELLSCFLVYVVIEIFLLTFPTPLN